MLLSSKYMLAIWIGCIVLGFAYIAFIWNGSDSLAFVVGQIVLGVIGIVREISINRELESMRSAGMKYI